MEKTSFTGNMGKSGPFLVPEWHINIAEDNKV